MFSNRPKAVVRLSRDFPVVAAPLKNAGLASGSSYLSRSPRGNENDGE
jgi:hypothetical protein